MDDGERNADRGARPRARKPTFTERRERRAEVEDIASVLDAAARFLEVRPRSVHEVRYKLTTMGYRAALVDEVVIRLTDLRYLDDEAFTRAWVESRDRSRPRGEHALRRELQLKGVERALVDEVLDQRRDEARGTRRASGDGSPQSPTMPRQSGCSARSCRRSCASRTRAGGASGRTRCSRAVGSPRTSAAPWPPVSSRRAWTMTTTPIARASAAGSSRPECGRRDPPA